MFLRNALTGGETEQKTELLLTDQPGGDIRT